ncbi:AAA domain-containing protein [Neobacillus niacini]|uniref:AAA domain-containing protein n=1 Tax=Neobacillus niacini TaxID=86668 RepID=UPI002FFDEE60
MKDKLVLLKDKLNDLSKRNRSIRMLKLYDKWAFDISKLNLLENENAQNVLKRVLEQQGKVKLVKQDQYNSSSLILSKKLNNLYRNIKDIEEETGLYDLYVGYPYITGCMLDGTYFRAPLFLYPAKLEMQKVNGTQWSLSFQDEGEPQLNRTLFLALKKFSSLSVSEKIYDEALEKARNVNYLSLISWLKEYSINVIWNNEPQLKGFIDYKQDEVPNFKKGQFQLEKMAILGCFPQGNSALLKDYEDLIALVEENQNPDLGILGELINVGLETEYSPIDGEEIKQSPTAEKEIFNILETDASQEDIIKEIFSKRGLVIHGPPGTGKSQVIVNLISNFISKNKRVLLVCQKRAALDVVYQRMDSLGLSGQVALLHDEKNDRKMLYSKLSNLLELNKPLEEYENELNAISKKIEDYETYLNSIATGLYEIQENGFNAYELYGLSKPIQEQEVILDKLHSVIGHLNKENLDDVLMKILSFGNYYGRLGGELYPLRNRKSFAKLELKDRLRIIEILNNTVQKAEQSKTHLDNLERDDLTPEYTWIISDKLEKIYEDLNPEEKKTLQKLRLWWWTSFTGKTIIEELLNGEKFNGLSSKEWPRLRDSLRILFELAQVSESMTKEIDTLNGYFQKESLEDDKKRIAKGDIPLKELQQKGEFIHLDFEDLRDMDRIYEESQPFIKALIDMLKEKYDDKIHREIASEWEEVVKQSAYIHWIDNVERKHAILTKIGTDEFDKINSQFKQLLLKKRELLVKVLLYRLTKKLFDTNEENPKAIRELKHQVSKKRMVWSVRKLVREFSNKGLLDSLPIWLTSPETASAIFPLENGLFDVVIFDEASQCTVENGLPCVYRGKKLIVAGDEKQLQPSTLFKGEIEVDEDDEEQQDLQESQSLLNLSKRVLPEKMLQWHYRSKSEELINFSNHAFYGGNIQIAPNVAPMKSPAAIQWHKTKGQWVNQHNALEAIKVVKLLKKVINDQPEKSVGIITFNSKQQEKIRDLIDNEVEKDKKFAVLYNQIMVKDLDQQIFIKNIENVQGDERDIIIFSIGYAQNEQGRVYNRFGTLGQQSGENRLNVAISRAKEQIHVVSSIEPHELSVDSSKNDGPKFLKSYLEYAKAVSKVNKDEVEAVLIKLNEDLNTKRQSTKTLVFDSPFEEQVYHQIVNMGYTVDTQVGMSRYRIDLAVVHPNEPNRYILGIECDGAMYHSSLSAKERDVYRQQFLENKGWKITRVWSRNWWKTQSTEIERLQRTIEGILQEEKVLQKV